MPNANANWLSAFNGDHGCVEHGQKHENTLVLVNYTSVKSNRSPLIAFDSYPHANFQTYLCLLHTIVPSCSACGVPEQQQARCLHLKSDPKPRCVYRTPCILVIPLSACLPSLFLFRTYAVSMRSFIRTLFRWRRPHKASNHQNQNVVTPIRAMFTGAVSAILYACTFSTPTSLGAVPEESEAKAHHLKCGNGFRNPWDSYREWGTGQIIRTMAW